MNMDTSWFMEWYWKEATEQEKRLFEKVGQFEDEGFFKDMLFDYGSSTYNLIKIKSKSSGETEWRDDSMTIPECFEYFDPAMIHYKVEDTGDETYGCYSLLDQQMCISPKYLDDDSCILHEMIHMHEFMLNERPLYWHDMVLWALYSDLKSKIPDLDNYITEHAHLLNGEQLFQSGGLHDILFFLKSLDLDLRMGYRYGTVFGYGKEKGLEN